MDVPAIEGKDYVLGLEDNYVRNIITFTEFQEELSGFDVFESYSEKFGADASESEDFLRSIYTEKIIKLSNDSLATYTLPIVTDLQIEDNRSFGNIVFILENDSLYAGMIHYNPAQEWVDEFVTLGVEHNYQGGITFIDNQGASIASGDMMDGVFYQTQSISEEDCDVYVVPVFVPCYGPAGVCPCKNGEGTWTTKDIVFCDETSGGSGSGAYDVPWPPPHYGGGGSGSSSRVNPFTPSEPVVPPLHINILLFQGLNDLLEEPMTEEQRDWIIANQENYEFAQFILAEIVTETFYEHNWEDIVGVLDEWDDYRGDMSASELAIFDDLSWAQQYKYLLSAYNASKMTENLYPSTLHNGLGDAYRHAFWNALSTIRIGETLTEQLTTAHEDKPSEYQFNYKENQMDLFNNQVGRQLVNNAGLLWQIVKTALENGELRYLKPLGFTVNGVFRPTFANASSLLTPTNQ